MPAFTTYLLNLDRDWVTTTLKQANNLKAIKDLEWELTMRSDSVAAFYDEKLIFEPGATVAAADVYKQYKDFCNDTGFSAKHQNNFCSALVNLLVDKLDKNVSSRKTKTGKVIDGLRLRNILDPIGDDGDGFSIFLQKTEKKLSVDPVTTVTTEQKFSSEVAPKPPSSDRPMPQTTKVGDYIEYLIVDDEVKWIEIYFHKHAIAKDWKQQAILWNCQTSDLQMLSHKKGNKWLLIIKGLTTAHLKMLLSADFCQSPPAAKRRQ